MSKKRVLICGESSWLSTGFAKFNREILEGINRSGKYELAEYGAYGSDNDEKARKLPWKFYGALPNNQHEAEVYKSDPRNAFGRYKFDAVVLDFQPDVVLDVRDPWMFEHAAASKLRNNFRLFLVPTVDSAPQRKEWIENIFKKTDVIGTYSRFGKRVLQAEGLVVTDVISPAVDLNTYKPISKEVVRDRFHLTPDLFIFGTVMRNQKRKLFPDLFTAYAALRGKYRKATKKISEKDVKRIQHSVLLCHTSWPDVGWDLPDLIYKFALQRHVIFTYKCDSCNAVFVSWFIPCDPKGMAQCRQCGKHTAHMPSTHNGIDDSQLAEIYNLMDVYIQPAICEGWGLPITEAKACGVPGLYQNYSAMEDHVENGGGLPIKIGRYYHEAETASIRSLPDIDDMVVGMEKLALNEDFRNKKAAEALKCAKEKHRWETTVQNVEKILDNIQIFDRATTWDRPPEIRELNTSRPYPNLTNEQFVYWCYVNILSRKPDDKGFSDWMNSLQNGTPREEVESFFRNEIIQGNNLEIQRHKKSCELRGEFTMIDEQEQINNQLHGVLL